jgi:drug/metabolite transporter (DMT)-like permease
MLTFFLTTKLGLSDGTSTLMIATASILAFSEPLTAALFGLIFLHQTIDIYVIIGIVMVTAAIVLINIHPHKTEIYVV